MRSRKLDNHYICPTCGWEYDGTVVDSDYSSANSMSIKEYRKTKTYNKTKTAQTGGFALYNYANYSHWVSHLGIFKLFLT